MSAIGISDTIAGWLRTPALAAQPTGWGADEWRAARWALQVHGVAPLLHESLLAAGYSAALPSDLRGYMAEQHRLSGLKMAAMLAELDRLLEACARAGLAVMPLKGAILARRYYRTPALRPSADLDLLVQNQQAAGELLASLGYRFRSWSWKHHTYARPEHSGPVVSFDGEHPDNPRTLDLHSRLIMQFWSIRCDMTTAAWVGSIPDPATGGAVCWMQPPALLLHLAIHAAEDIIARRLRLLQLHDIALVAPRLTPADWDALLAAAHACREERLLYAPLALAARYLGSIPPDVIAALRGHVAPGLLSYLDGVGVDQVSFCNTAPTLLSERLRWFRPGLELADALRHALLPDPSELASWFPELATTPHRLPLAYARYSLSLGRWGAARLLGLTRRSLSRR